MAADDFLVKFRVDNKQAMAALSALAKRAAQVEAALNRVGVRGAGGSTATQLNQQALATQRLANAQKSQAQAAAAQARAQTSAARTAQIHARTTQILTSAQRAGQRAHLAYTDGLRSTIQRTEEMIRANEMLGRAPQAVGLARGVIAAQKLVRATAAGTIENDRAVASFNRLNTVLQANRFAFDQWTRTFGHHALRIAEGLIIYNAFARAIEGVTAALQLVAQTDLEMERLSQVLGGLSETQADSFLKGLGDIAVQTNTDISKLVGTTDLIAGAFRGLPEGQQQEGILAMQRLAGEFSNVLGTGRSQEQVAEDLFGLFRLMNFPINTTGIAQFREFLDFLVVAGRRSAFGIESIHDALLATGATANTIGLDFKVLSFALDDLTQGFTAAGDAATIGTRLNTILGKFTNTPIVESIEEITEGIISVKDASGGLRTATDIILQITEAISSGEIVRGSPMFKELMENLAAPLQPGSVGLVTRFFDAVGNGLERMRTEGAGATGALEDLSAIFVQSLAGRFGAFIQKIKTGILAVRHDIEDFLGSLLGLGNSIVDFFGLLGASTTLTIVKFLAFVGSAKLLLVILSRFGLLLTSMSASFLLASARTGTFASTLLFGATAGTQMGLGLTAAGVGASRLQVAMGGLMAVMSRFLPILLAFAAIEVASSLLSQADQISTLRDRLGLSETEAQSLVHDLKAGQKPGAERTKEGSVAPVASTTLQTRFGVGSLGGLTEQQAGGAGAQERIQQQIENVLNLTNAIKQLEDTGQDTPDVIRAMEAAVLNANTANEVLELSTTELIEAGLTNTQTIDAEAQSMQELLASLGLTSEAMNQFTAEQQIANQAMELQRGLVEETSDAYSDLVDRLREGKITAEEFATGTDAINQAADLASQLVAATNEQLAQMPQFAGPAAQGMDALAAAVFQVFLGASNTIPMLQPLIAQIVRVAAASAGAATATVAWSRANTAAGATMTALREGSARTVQFALNQMQQVTAAASGTASALMNILNSIFSIANSGISTPFGTGPSGGGGVTSSGPGRGLLDLGDFPPAMLAQAIALAQQLQNNIPGANAEAAGSIIDVIKDAVFLMTIQGIDSQLLQTALDELTEQMEEANRLEEERMRKEAVLSNLVVNAGPLAGLISQPTAFGVGGNLAQGTGLNFDPTKGNFVINVPIELQGLNPAALQQLVYDIISKAIRDALRL